MAIRLRTHLTSNLWLIFASIFIAFVIWLIAKEGQYVDRSLQVQIRIERPPNAEITVAPNEASVNLRLPVSQAHQVTRANCWVEINPDLIGDPSDWHSAEFEKTIRLHPTMVVLDNLPHTVQAVSVEPPTIRVSGRLHSVEALVDPRIIGEPAKGFRLAQAPRADPETIRLTASPAVLQALPRDKDGKIRVTTMPIDLKDHDAYFEAQVDLVLPEGVDVATGFDRRVHVIVPIEELTGERTIEGVPIRVQTFSRAVQARIEPTKASVKVEGPLTLIRNLTPEDFSVTPKEALREEAGAAATLALDCQFHESVGRRERERVHILGVTPKSVSVEMVSQATPTPPPPPTATPSVRLLTPVPTPASTPAETPPPAPAPTALALAPTPPATAPRADGSSTSSLFEPLRPLGEPLEPPNAIEPAPLRPLAPFPAPDTRPAGDLSEKKSQGATSRREGLVPGFIRNLTLRRDRSAGGSTPTPAPPSATPTETPASPEENKGE